MPSIKAKEIFPSTKTTTINKLITENSLTRLLNRLMDVNGYIISSELDSIDVSDVYNYVNVEGELMDSNLEICIRGYYFNLGTFSEVLGQIIEIYEDETLNVGDIFKAAIFIDNSNPDYPELYGNDSYSEKIITVIESSDIVPIDDGYLLNTIKCYDGVGNLVSYDFIPGTTTYTDLISNSIATVNYWVNDKISCIYIYRETENESSREADSIPLNYKEYDLPLFELYENTVSPLFRIPISSFHKFSSVSIQTIDGGLIK